MKKTYQLKYEMYGTECTQETTDLHRFMQMLEDVEQRSEVLNSSIVINTVESEVK